MAKKAKKAKKAKTGQQARKAKARKGAAPKPRAAARALTAAAGKPDKRLPVHGDPNHEILCKWITAINQYQCRQVPTGGDWNP
jgi:hypothetical protein